LETRRDQMRAEIATLRQELARLEAQRDSLLTPQINLLKDLARDLLLHWGIDTTVPANDTDTLVQRFVRHVHRFIGGRRLASVSARRREVILAQMHHTVEELLRLAQALVMTSSR
jgi:hypothetical protein